jgi:hypothetical protein
MNAVHCRTKKSDEQRQKTHTKPWGNIKRDRWHNLMEIQCTDGRTSDPYGTKKKAGERGQTQKHLASEGIEILSDLH